ncbi:hypothetical protein FHL15_007140 [Xylaria flabelliformis]|uniref:Uncharacterized protein n=1 Tax=Xylaria flabelliformis TaxID=2512241 RepID=A0A553HVS9_9PEZI|nr:hypothetical protein FHL15_007140 [Xylaria flabelliformis]
MVAYYNVQHAANVKAGQWGSASTVRPGTHATPLPHATLVRLARYPPRDNFQPESYAPDRVVVKDQASTSFAAGVCLIKTQANEEPPKELFSLLASHLVFREGHIAISNASPCKLTRCDVMALGRHISTSQSDPYDGLAYMLVGGVFRVPTVAEVGVDEGSLPVEPINPSHGYQCYVRCSGHADTWHTICPSVPPYSKNDLSRIGGTYGVVMKPLSVRLAAGPTRITEELIRSLTKAHAWRSVRATIQRQRWNAALKPWHTTTNAFGGISANNISVIDVQSRFFPTEFDGAIVQFRSADVARHVNRSLSLGWWSDTSEAHYTKYPAAPVVLGTPYLWNHELSAYALGPIYAIRV